MNNEESIKKLKPSEEKIWQKEYSEEGKNFSFPKMNIYDLVYEENRNRKDYIALEYEGNQIRYGDFFDKVEERTDFFQSKNVADNEVVTISSLLTPDFVYDFYALGRLNAISNLIDPRTSVEGIKKYIDEANSRLFISNDLFLGKLKEAIDKEDFEVVVNSLFSGAKNLEYPLNAVSILTGIKSKLMQIKDSRYTTYSNENISNYKLNSKNGDLTIAHTGGSTGMPKGVVLTHDNYNATAMQYLKSNIGFCPRDKFMIIMPPWISYGSGLVHTSLVGGMTAQLLPKPDSKKMDDAIIKHKPTWFAGVTAHYVNILERDKAKKDSFASVKSGAIGGGTAPAQLFDDIEDYFKKHGCTQGIIPGYGLTECSSTLAARQTEKFKPGSSGQPLPGAVMGIFKYDETTGKTTEEELGYNEIGELCLQTPTMMKGYFKNPEATNKVLVKHSDGSTWIHTGDLAYIDEDGFLYISSRIKELIIRNDGFKVYPNQIERIVADVKGVETVKVVGVRDKVNSIGEVPKVYFTVMSGFEDKVDDIYASIKNECETKLAEYYVEGISYKCLEKMPLTPIGKIDFQELKKYDEDEAKVLRR